MYRRAFLVVAYLLIAAVIGLAFVWPPILWSLLVIIPLTIVGTWDAFQKQHAVLRNFPLIGHFRYVFEAIRPEIQQYFVESDTDGRPFNREFRALVYQRAKGDLDTTPFGTQVNVYEHGYEWMNHSLRARPGQKAERRVRIGGPACLQPYEASHLNISAMSYGSLSSHSIRALGLGAKAGGFWLNTGEGGVSDHHLDTGADLVWQVGTGYFGCRAPDGSFDAEAFEKRSAHPHIKMIELKLSQGAKPGHGGILPAAKITPEIARIRGVERGKDVVSPPGHSTFNTPVGLLKFVQQLRELSRGKPIGIKLCIGDRVEFLCVVKAMLETGIYPDFIVVDGAEGGTGAAPLEFSNSVGWPMREALVFVHNVLTGADIRQHIRVIASGKIITGFHMVRALALGADLLNSARGFMLALGCIQARRCNSNHCPVGVATQDPTLMRGLVVSDKAPRVARYHEETIHSLLSLCGAAGLDEPQGIRPEHVWRRTDERTSRHYGEIYDFLEPGALLRDPLPEAYRAEWLEASGDAFRQAGSVAGIARTA